MLRILKVNIVLEVKGDPEDQDDLKDRINELLQIAIEEDELNYTIEEDEDVEILEMDY